MIATMLMPVSRIKVAMMSKNSVDSMDTDRAIFIGQIVEKRGGNYQTRGIVRAGPWQGRSGLLYVVEFEVIPGCYHIFSEAQLYPVDADAD